VTANDIQSADDIKTASDIETLRQVALALWCENERLKAENARLREQAEHGRKRRYGRSSERRKRETATAEREPTPKRGHGPTPQPRLQVETEYVPLSEERTCEYCNGTFGPIDGMTEDSEVVTVIERRFVVKQVKRQKYRCRCGIGLITAPAPPKLLPGGRYSLEFATHVAVEKYLMHVPLARQCRDMQRRGLKTTTQALYDQNEALARLWQPVYQLLPEYQSGSDVVGMDETQWLVMLKGSPSKRWWVWSITTPDAVFYHIAPSRGAAVAASLLGDYTGVVVCDGYSAYKSLAKQTSDIRLALCWSHVRRKFVEAEPNYPTCNDALALIGELFALDRDTPNPALLSGDAKLAACAARMQARQERAPAILAKLLDWAKKQQGLPTSGLRRAIAYMDNRWDDLQVFLEDPFVPLDNNATERALRTVVLGRKNHYGSRSQRGTEVAALFYSILETAVLNGLDPSQYMVEGTRALLGGAPPRSVLPISRH
jgi:transposase